MFQVTDLRSLSAFRFAYCLLLAVTVVLKGPSSDRLLAARIYNPIPLFEVLHIPQAGLEVFQGLRLALVAGLALGAIGLLTRPALVASTLLYFLYFGTQLGFSKASGTNYVYHSENMVFFVLLVLGMSPHVGLWGVDGMRRRGWRWSPDPGETQGSPWALPLLATLLGLVYFGSAWCKLTASPLWADGETLQAYLYVKYLLADTELGYRIAQSWWLCLFLGIATIVLEAGFWTVCLFPRRAWLYALSGLAFHVGIYLAMNINFLLYHCYTYLLFAFWPRRGAENPGPATAAGVSRPERAFAVGILLVFLACIFGRIESWPFSDFRVYEQRHSLARVRVYRVAGIDSEGKSTWIPRADLPRSETTLNAEFVRVLGRRDRDEAGRILEEVAAAMPPESLKRYRSLAVVRRTLDAQPGRPVTPVDLTVLSIPVETPGEH